MFAIGLLSKHNCRRSLAKFGFSVNLINMTNDMINDNEEYLLAIRNEFEQKKLKNKRYSLRAFSKFLGLNHATLSQIMSKQKGLSLKMAIKISNRMGLDSIEKNKFLTSVTKCFSRSPARRLEAEEKLKTLAKHKKVSVTKHDEIPTINHWSHVAVFEVILTAKANKQPDIAQVLDIPEIKVAGILHTLINLGFIAKSEEAYHALRPTIHTTNDIPNEAIAHYHASICTKAAESIHKQSVQIREFQNAIMCVDPKDLPAAKQMLRDFAQEFYLKFHNEISTNKIYSFSANFFKLSKNSDGTF